MHFVYILYSARRKRYYIGETEDVVQRLHWHNDHLFQKSSTIIANDWQLKKVIVFRNRREARRVETYIKSMKSSVFLQRLISEESFYLKFKALVKEHIDIEIQ